jgi:hypothetical protein
MVYHPWIFFLVLCNLLSPWWRKITMRTIWKFLVEPFDEIKIEMPKGAEILTVQNQKENIQLWAIVNPNVEKEIRKFHVYSIGQEMNNINEIYIGTFQIDNGDLVFHLFEFK